MKQRLFPGACDHHTVSSNAWLQKDAFGPEGKHEGNKENQSASELLLFPACFQGGSNLRTQLGAACVDVAPQEAGLEIFSPRIRSGSEGRAFMFGSSGGVRKRPMCKDTYSCKT